MGSDRGDKSGIRRQSALEATQDNVFAYEYGVEEKVKC